MANESLIPAPPPQLPAKRNWKTLVATSPDDYSKIAYSPEEAARVRKHISHLVTGATAAIPLLCPGSAKCPFAPKCPFVRIDQERKAAGETLPSVVPLGMECLVEVNLLNEWTNLYLEEYQIDATNFTEFSMIRELAEIELMLWRINNNQSKVENAEFMKEQAVGINKQGETIYRLEIHPLTEVKERLTNRKSKLVKLMVGDRQEKYKRDAALKIKSEDDPSISASRLRGQIDKLISRAKLLDAQVKDKQGQVVDAEGISVSENIISPEDLISEESH